MSTGLREETYDVVITAGGFASNAINPLDVTEMLHHLPSGSFLMLLLFVLIGSSSSTAGDGLLLLLCCCAKQKNKRKKADAKEDPKQKKYKEFKF
jgi:hypothetical protein